MGSPTCTLNIGFIYAHCSGVHCMCVCGMCRAPGLLATYNSKYTMYVERQNGGVQQGAGEAEQQVCLCRGVRLCGVVVMVCIK